MADVKKSDDYAIDMEKLNADGDRFKPRSQSQTRGAPSPPIANHPMLPIISYCGSSILMTVTNKYVLSGHDFNLQFFLLCIQVCGQKIFPRKHGTVPDDPHIIERGLHLFDSGLQVHGLDHLPQF